MDSKISLPLTAMLKTGSKLLIILCLFFLAACQKDDDFSEQLNNMLSSMAPISTAFPPEQPVTLDNTTEEKDTEYIYKIDYYTVAAGYDEQIVLNPQTDVIYPGALIKGESILDGSYVPISARRRPVTISTSLTGSEKVFTEVPDPKLSTIRSAINSLMNQTYNVPPANMGFTIEQAYSESQLNLSLRASYKGVVNVSAGFDYSNKKIKTRLIAKFIQNYYTLDMDLPANPADLFEDNVNESLFGTYMPMYISSVTYGRMALFTIESELEETQVRAFLQGSYASVSASASAEFEALNATSTMKVYILGGSGADAGMTVNGFEAFKNYIITGGNFSKDSPGAPISYKLRYIHDNTIGKIVFAASYPIRTALPRRDNIRYDVDVYFYQLKSHVDDWGTYCELRGTIHSYVKNNKEATNHNHFTGIDMPETGTTNYPENVTTKNTKTALLENDTVTLHLHIWEDNDFNFPVGTFDYPVADFVLGSGLSTGTHDTMDELKLWALGHGETYYVIPRFKFTYNSYRVDD
jgi:thiol-activated cytolysin